MTFSLVKKGARAVRAVRFPTIDGTAVEGCGVRVMNDTLFDAIETAARKAAIDRGVAEPREGNPIYDRWTRIFTVLYGCVDIATCRPGDAPDLFLDEGEAVLFFDGGAEQIQTHLDPERIAYLAAMQTQWQQLVSPRPRGLSFDEYRQSVYATSIATIGDGTIPFWQWHPALQESWLISTARLLVTSPPLKSAPGSSSEENTRSDSASGEGAGDNPFDSRVVVERILDEIQSGVTYPTEVAPRAPAGAVAKSRGRAAKKARRR